MARISTQILLFTDGIVEALSADGEFLGLQRLLDIVRPHQHSAPDAILEALFCTAVIIKAEAVLSINEGDGRPRR